MTFQADVASTKSVVAEWLAVWDLTAIIPHATVVKVYAQDLHSYSGTKHGRFLANCARGYSARRGVVRQVSPHRQTEVWRIWRQPTLAVAGFDSYSPCSRSSQAWRSRDVPVRCRGLPLTRVSPGGRHSGRTLPRLPEPTRRKLRRFVGEVTCAQYENATHAALDCLREGGIRVEGGDVVDGSGRLHF